MNTSRRDALRLIGAAPIAVGFGIGAAQAEAAGAHAAAVLQAAAKGQPYKPRFFSPREWETVRILVDLILPRDARSGSATDAGVPEFMDYLMNDPQDSDRARESRQTAMRGGLAWIHAECVRRFGRDFLDCAPEQRTALLDDIAYPPAEEPDDTDLREPRDVRVRVAHGPAFFSSFRDLTASGFWTSKMGVEDLGYIGNTLAQWEGPPREVLQRLGLKENE